MLLPLSFRRSFAALPTDFCPRRFSLAMRSRASNYTEERVAGDGVPAGPEPGAHAHQARGLLRHANRVSLCVWQWPRVTLRRIRARDARPYLSPIRFTNWSNRGSSYTGRMCGGSAGHTIAIRSGQFRSLGPLSLSYVYSRSSNLRKLCDRHHFTKLRHRAKEPRMVP